MQLCKVRRPNGETAAGVLADGRVRLLGPTRLSDVLHAADPADVARSLLEPGDGVAVEQVKLLPPIDAQEVWAAGVTYKRSKEAREEESAGARSEEHTSELQSRGHLVCRLLLEKKKKKTHRHEAGRRRFLPALCCRRSFGGNNGRNRLRSGNHGDGR